MVTTFLSFLLGLCGGVISVFRCCNVTWAVSHEASNRNTLSSFDVRRRLEPSSKIANLTDLQQIANSSPVRRFSVDSSVQSMVERQRALRALRNHGPCSSI